MTQFKKVISLLMTLIIVLSTLSGCFSLIASAVTSSAQEITIKVNWSDGAAAHQSDTVVALLKSDGYSTGYKPTLNSANNFTYTVTGRSGTHDYTLDNIASTATGYVNTVTSQAGTSENSLQLIINAYPEDESPNSTSTTDVNVDLNWSDGITLHSSDSITVLLMSDGVSTGKTLTLNSSNAFSGTFTGLSGTHEYSIEQQSSVSGYDYSISASEQQNGWHKVNDIEIGETYVFVYDTNKVLKEKEADDEHTLEAGTVTVNGDSITGVTPSMQWVYEFTKNSNSLYNNGIDIYSLRNVYSNKYLKVGSHSRTQYGYFKTVSVPFNYSENGGTVSNRTVPPYITYDASAKHIWGYKADRDNGQNTAGYLQGVDTVVYQNEVPTQYTPYKMTAEGLQFTISAKKQASVWADSLNNYNIMYKWRNNKRSLKSFAGSELAGVDVSVGSVIPADHHFGLGSYPTGKSGITVPSTAIARGAKGNGVSVAGWSAQYIDACSLENSYAFDMGAYPEDTPIPAGQVYARYSNVGKYNGQEIDVRISVIQYGCEGKFYDQYGTSARATVIAFPYNNLGVGVCGADYVELQYDFYLSGTDLPVNVKGYTTYSDIDIYQGIILHDNCDGILVSTTGNYSIYDTVRGESADGAPYIYDYDYNNSDHYSNYSGTASAHATFTELFSGNEITRTFTFVRDRAQGGNGHIFNESGAVVSKETTTSISCQKIWDDNYNADKFRPSSLQFQIYQNGVAYSDPFWVYTGDCQIKNVNGHDVWYFTIDNLPNITGVTYSIKEVNEPNYYATTSTNTVVTNTVIPEAKIKTIKYELYLVDENGNPITLDGEETTFENREVMSNEVSTKLNNNNKITVNYDVISSLIPDGYVLYNPNATFECDFKGLETKVTINDSGRDDRVTTHIYDPRVDIDEQGSVKTYNDMGSTRTIGVAFAIYKQEINPDVVVVDYGKTIQILPLLNDVGAHHIVALSSGNQRKTDSDAIKANNGYFHIISESYGKAVSYTPFKYMSSIDIVNYEVIMIDNETHLSSTITVIPATTVYYEDDFGGSAENGGLYIKYTGDWYTVTDNNQTTNTLVKKANTNENDIQDCGEVGRGHTPYGYDSSYNGCTKFSNGTAAYVEGTVSKDADGKSQFDAKAEFTFTGTGFDLISRTDFDCGQITIQIFDHETKERIGSNVPVINKGSEGSVLYQIPVISYTGLAYDTYDVVINVNAASKLLGLGNHFYLDAIRIYDPMGTKSSENAEFDDANEAYHTDKEANAYVASIRDFIIQIGDLGVDEALGAVYVDTVSNDYCNGGTLKFGNIRKPTFTDEQKRWRSMKEEDLNSFELVGPNEEVYLTPGKGIGFKIESSQLPESVQLGIKLPKPIANSESTLTVQTVDKSGSLDSFDVASADEMFYSISDSVVFEKVNDKYTATVILSNGLNGNDNDIVSITNLKMTFTDADADPKPINQNIQNVESSLVRAEKDETGIPNVTIKASKDIYKKVFDTVYVQRIASAPNFDIENFESNSSVCKGEYLTVKFNTAKTVKNVEILDENGKVMKLENVQCTVDDSKQFTDDYQNTKSWSAKVRVLKNEGDYEFTAKAMDGEGEEVKIPVTVTPAEIAELRIAQMPEKREYNYGEKLDFSKLEIDAIYTDGNVVNVTNNIDVNDKTANKNGVKEITVSFSDFSASFDVYVFPVAVGIDIRKVPEVTDYMYNDKINPNGLELCVTYSDGEKETVTEGFKLSNDTADTEGKMTVGVEYEGFETNFDVNVKLTFWQKIVRLVKNIITTVKDLFAKIF